MLSLGLGLWLRVSKVVITSSVWILLTNIWNDGGVWDDASTWND